MIQVSQLKKSFGSRVLFQDVTFSISKRERVGLVGRNGCGKSTLFKIILGQESEDQGQMTVPKGYKIGYLDQHIHFTKPTVLEECCSVLSEEEKYDFYKAEKLLFGLGFSENDMTRSPQEFSGGFQLRINLVKSLLKNPDLLLLDEPTNYLDLLSLRWLRQFLHQFQGEVILITHDRDFMDTVVTHTMGISRGILRKIPGQTSDYYEKVFMEEELHEKTRVNQEKKVKHLQSFVDRFGAKATKASQAQSKLKQIQKIKISEALSKEAIIGFRFNYKEIASKNLLNVNQLGFSYTGNMNETLFKNLSFQLKPQSRIAVIGKNGKGKSTLLNVLAHQLKPTEGAFQFHSEVQVGYYQQTHKKNLKPSYSVYDEIASVNLDLGISEVRSICGAVMFPGDDALKKISVLSGGEQGRVLLGKILAQPTNVLLLDEPSNHLDMESIEVMSEEIQNFPGGVLFVTHNESLLRELATGLIIFKRNSALFFNGTYDEFLEKIGWEDEESSFDLKEKKSSEQNLKQDLKNTEASSLKELSYEERKERNKKLRKLEKEIDKIENEIHHLEESLKEKNETVEKALLNNESSQIQEVYQSIGQIQTEIEEKFQVLEDLHKSLEDLS